MKISRKWIIVSIYTAGIFAAIPYLPQLINAASSRWSRSGVKYFVLGVEIAIALFILILAVRFLIYRRKKAVIFFSSVGSIFLLSFLLYQFIPNPFEFTHLPEYAALSMLIVWAAGKEKPRIAGTPEKKIVKSPLIKNS
jgi:predicted membrane protein